tara:strand:+ start:525 stop:1109 length:585 start_codon:yes stop_codon:yes gene_type:complete
MALAIGAGVSAALAALKAGAAAGGAAGAAGAAGAGGGGLAAGLKTAGSAIKAGAKAAKIAKGVNKAARAAKIAKAAPKVTTRLQAAQSALQNQGLRTKVGDWSQKAVEAAPEGLQEKISGTQNRIQKAKDWRDKTFWDFEGGDAAREKFQKRAIGNIQDQLQQASEPAAAPSSEPTMDQYGQDVADLRRMQRGY